MLSIIFYENTILLYTYIKAKKKRVWFLLRPKKI